MNSNITGDGLSAKLETGIILSTSSNPIDLTYNNAKAQTVKSTLTTSGKITMVFNSLTVGTKYYYVSYAKNEAGTSYSPVCSFTTLENTAPTLDQTCVAASSVGVDVATITGNVLSDGGISTLEKGFIFNSAMVFFTRAISSCGSSTWGLLPPTTCFLKKLSMPIFLMFRSVMQAYCS